MKSLHIRDVSEETIEALKQLARMHHRSLQGELKRILDDSASLAKLPSAPGFKLNQVSIGGKASWSREAIYGDEGR
jgi:plasmid stability protein